MNLLPRRAIRSAIAIAAVVCAVPAATASVVTYMDTEALTRSSPVIVRGAVGSIVSRSDSGYAEIHTDVTVHVEEAFRGSAAGARIDVRLLGGSVDGRQSFVFGSPEFRRGERVLLFLQPTRAGFLTVTGLYQGKYRIESQDGRDVAVRESAGEAQDVLRGGKDREPAQRPLASVLAEVRGLVTSGPAPAAHVAAGVGNGPSELSSPDLGFTLRPLIPLRWFEPDSGIPVTMRFNPANAPANVPGGARPQYAAAAANWTAVTGSTIVMQDVGDTTAACWLNDGINLVAHGDACDQVPDFDPDTCSGVLAITGIANFSLESRVVNGTSFLRIREQDIIINSGTDCFFADPGNYGEVVAHEMGHVLGLGHSCGDAFSPACATDPLADAALMAAFAHADGRGPTPQADDINGVRFMYPPPGFVDAKLNADAFGSGDTIRLTADFNGTARADVYFILLLPDGTFYALGASTLNVLVPLAPNLQLGFALDAPLFTHTFGGAEPGGTYVWYALLVTPGADPLQPANWLGVDVAAFTFAP